MSAIELENISYTYPGGTRALDDVSLKIEAGELVAIVGQNGAGKTTLVKMANALLRPTLGSVRLHGRDIRQATTASLAREIGFVFQNPRTQIFLGTVEEEIAFGPSKIGMSQDTIKQRLESALQSTGLSAYRHSHPYDLTPAERKLLTIASIISMDQEILILDEPTGGLDITATDAVLQVIKSYKDQGRTVIAVTHDMDFVARGFKRAVVMNRGRIVADDQVSAVFSRHDLLAEAHLEPTAISLLASKCGFPTSILTVKEMVKYLVT